VGINLGPYNFHQNKIVEINWKSDILEYESNNYSGTNIIPLRIEFNSLGFQGEKGGLPVGVMIQNLLHKYDEASCTVDSMPGGVELYFSVLDRNLLDNDTTNDIIGGVKLDADPNTFPKFRRVFQDIDGLSIVGNNIYANDAVVVPDKQTPPTIEWKVKRGSLVTNPAGNLHKNIDCQWQQLLGDYREWMFSVKIDGSNYSVGTFYLPEDYASYLHPNRPIRLHQEHFGSCNSRLDVNKGQIEYYDFKVFSESSEKPVNIPDWKTYWKIDDECGNNDLRYGIGTVFRDNKKRIFTSVGHEDDVNLTRQIGIVFYNIDGSGALINVTLTPNVDPPQFNGTNVNWTCTADDEDPSSLTYRFYLRGNRTNNNWVRVQPGAGWSPDNTWTWETNSNDFGFNRIRCKVKDDVGQINKKVYKNYLIKDNGDDPPANVTLTPNLDSPQFNGTKIDWTCGCDDEDPASLTYKFLLRGNRTNDAWEQMQPSSGWSSDNTWTWETNGSDFGFNRIKCKVKDNIRQKNSNVYMNYLIKDSGDKPPTNVTLTPSVDPPQINGTSIDWTCAADDENPASLTYKFLLKGNRTNDVWGQMQPISGWSPDNTWTWQTNNNDIGLNRIMCKAKDNFDNQKNTVYTGFEIT
jgi:hypothetical protein